MQKSKIQIKNQNRPDRAVYTHFNPFYSSISPTLNWTLTQGFD
jgi:hypothetical protein